MKYRTRPFIIYKFKYVLTQNFFVDVVIKIVAPKAIKKKLKLSSGWFFFALKSCNYASVNISMVYHIFCFWF